MKTAEGRRVHELSQQQQPKVLGKRTQQQPTHPCREKTEQQHAATFGSFHAAAMTFVQRSFGPGQQGQGQALYATLAGVGGAAGALYAGYAWNTLGPTITFSMASVAALAAAVIIATRLQEDGP